MANDIQEEKHFDELTFEEALARSAQEDKSRLIFATIEQFKKGDANAMKAVFAALAKAEQSDEARFPIPDERFKEIILMASERINHDGDRPEWFSHDQTWAKRDEQEK